MSLRNTIGHAVLFCVFTYLTVSRWIDWRHDHDPVLIMWTVLSGAFAVIELFVIVLPALLAIMKRHE